MLNYFMFFLFVLLNLKIDIYLMVVKCNPQTQINIFKLLLSHIWCFI